MAVRKVKLPTNHISYNNGENIIMSATKTHPSSFNIVFTDISMPGLMFSLLNATVSRNLGIALNAHFELSASNTT